MTPKEKRDAKNARHKRNEQRRRQRWLDRIWDEAFRHLQGRMDVARRAWFEEHGVPDRDKQA